MYRWFIGSILFAGIHRGVMLGLYILFMFDADEQWASATVSIMALLCVQMTSKVTNAGYWSKIKTVFWLKK
jgi:hypothetical protein